MDPGFNIPIPGRGWGNGMPGRGVEIPALAHGLFRPGFGVTRPVTGWGVMSRTGQGIALPVKTWGSGQGWTGLVIDPSLVHAWGENRSTARKTILPVMGWSDWELDVEGWLVPSPLSAWGDATGVARSFLIPGLNRGSGDGLARGIAIPSRHYSADEESIQLEIDDRADGPNAGHTSFYAGDVVYLLAYHGPGMSGLSAVSSAGEVWHNGEVEIQLEEDISFDDGDTATLAKPAISLDNVTWLGTDLGDLVLESDRVSLTAKTSGTAIARVSYTAHATSFGLATSESLGDETAYPIDVRVTGETTETTGAGEIVCRRGAGEFPGDDIEEALLSTLDAKLSRGRAEIDAGEVFESIILRTTCQPTLMPGDLIEVQDSIFGAPWRGKITSITHEQNGGPITTTLEVLRHVQSAE